MKVIFEGEKEKQKNDFPLRLYDLKDGEGFELSNGQIGLLHHSDGHGRGVLGIIFNAANCASGFAIQSDLSAKCRRRQLRITVDPL